MDRNPAASEPPIRQGAPGGGSNGSDQPSGTTATGGTLGGGGGGGGNHQGASVGGEARINYKMIIYDLATKQIEL